MLAIAGYEVQQKLYEGVKSLVYSGRRLRDGQPVVLKLIRDDYPSPERVARYQQEYETTRQLNVEWVIKVDRLEQVNNRPVIILEDFGGVSLGQYSRTVQRQVGDWLRLA